ncbi:MAG: phage head-tail connector protein [Zavarzinella sp.]
MAIDSLANIKIRLGITGTDDDTLLTDLQSSADAWINTFTGRTWNGGTFTEYFAGNQSHAVVQNYPIAEVSSVKVDLARSFGSDSLLDSSRYLVHANRGVIQATAGMFVPGAGTALVNNDRRTWMALARVVQVVYTVADAPPIDLKQAYARLIGYWYRTIKTEVASNYQNVSQQKYGDSFFIYQVANRLDFPAEITTMIRHYRSPAV